MPAFLGVSILCSRQEHVEDSRSEGDMVRLEMSCIISKCFPHISTPPSSSQWCSAGSPHPPLDCCKSLPGDLLTQVSICTFAHTATRIIHLKYKSRHVMHLCLKSLLTSASPKQAPWGNFMLFQETCDSVWNCVVSTFITYAKWILHRDALVINYQWILKYYWVHGGHFLLSFILS